MSEEKRYLKCKNRKDEEVELLIEYHEKGATIHLENGKTEDICLDFRGFFEDAGVIVTKRRN